MKNIVTYEKNKDKECDSCNYKIMIVNLVEGIVDEEFLKFIYSTLVSFRRKWGI